MQNNTKLKGSVEGLALGLFFFFVCLFISLSLNVAFVYLSPNTVNLMKSGILLLGVISIFLGALSR